MAGVMATEGYGVLLDTLLTNQATHLHLYKSNTTPATSSTHTTFTEADFTGYASVTLSAGSWNASTLVSTKQTATYGSAQTFTNTGSSQTIYGYYITNTANDKLIGAELFSSSITLATGGSVNVTPTITYLSQ